MTHKQQDIIGIMQRFIELQKEGIFPWGRDKYTVQLRKMLYSWMANEIVTTETEITTRFGDFLIEKKVSHVNQCSLLEWWTQQAKKSEIVLFHDFSFSDDEEEDLGLEEDGKESQELKNLDVSSPPPPQYNYQVGDSGDELPENEEDSGDELHENEEDRGHQKDYDGSDLATGSEKDAGGYQDSTDADLLHKTKTRRCVLGGMVSSKVKYGTFFPDYNKDKKVTLNMDNFGGKKDYWIGEPSSLVFDEDAKTGDKIHVGYLSGVGWDYEGTRHLNRLCSIDLDYDSSEFQETLPLDFKNIGWYFRCCGMCKKKVNHANDIVMKEITINGMKYWRSANDWRPMFIDDRRQIGTGDCFSYGRKYVGMLMVQ